MNLLILTKISKYAFIGSTSAALSFISKHNSSFQLAFIYLLIGASIITLIAIYWEGRRLLSSPTEEGLTEILSSVSTNTTNKRNYLLPAHIRLEIIVALLVVLVFALVGKL